MIWTFISIGLFIIGLVVSLVETKNVYSQIDHEIMGMVAMLSGFIATVICVLLIIFAHTNVDYHIEKNNMEYEGLQKRIEIIQSEYEDVSDSVLIKDITDWNTRVHSCIHWSKSPWTNWFYSTKEIEALHYIEY